MRIYLITVGTRMPAWVRQGYEDYATRLPPQCSLRLVEIPAAKRGKQMTRERSLREEGERILAAIPAGTRVIVLEVNGREWDTEELSRQLSVWLQDGRDVALLIGGPEGLDPACRARAEMAWSLSKLTLPHILVRIVVTEQLYRAWSILHHHPYHRA